jgi:Heterokaryon incompatibility protein (HET)
MRLLNSLTEETTVFISDEAIPPYAILSHTWGEEEVSLQDLPNSKAKLKAGYRKIRYACDQARKDGIAWVWVDTYANTHHLQLPNVVVS